MPPRNPSESGNLIQQGISGKTPSPKRAKRSNAPNEVTHGRAQDHCAERTPANDGECDGIQKRR